MEAVVGLSLSQYWPEAADERKPLVNRVPPIPVAVGDVGGSDAGGAECK